MPRIHFLLAGLLLSVVSLGSDSAKEYDDETEHAGIEGRWLLTESGIETAKPYRGEAEVLSFRGRTFKFEYPISNKTSAGTCWTNPARVPHHLELTALSGNIKGRKFRWIYEIEGDTLRIAGDLDSAFERHPQAFNEKGLRIWVYKRAK